MISWQPHHHAQWVVLFWQRAASENVAGMANCDKSLGVYPVFGTFRGTNPPLHWSWIPVLTHQALRVKTRKQWGLFVHGNTNLAEWAGSWLVRSDRLCKHLHMTVTCNTRGRGWRCGSVSVCSYSTHISFLSAVNWICIGCWFDSLITPLLHYLPLRLDHVPVWFVARISISGSTNLLNQLW